MTPDPFEGLSLPIAPVRPREAFLADLRRRVHAELGVPLEDSGDGSNEDELAFSEVGSAAPVGFALHYLDLTGAVHWLVEVLGMTVSWAYPSIERPEHAELAWGAGRVSVNTKQGMYWQLGPTAVLLDVATIAELESRYDRVVAVRADIARPIGADWDRRNRVFVVRDPEGNLWQLSAAADQQ